MKEPDVQRSVRAQRFSRSAGDAPVLGKVVRVRNNKSPKGALQRRRRSGPRTSHDTPIARLQKKVILTWTVLLLLGVFGVLAFFFWSWLKARMG